MRPPSPARPGSNLDLIRASPIAGVARASLSARKARLGAAVPRISIWCVATTENLAELPDVEVPVSYHSRRAGRSKVSGTVRGTLLAARYILGVTLRYAWGARRA